MLKTIKIVKKIILFFFIISIFFPLYPVFCSDYNSKSIFPKDCSKEHKEFIVKYVFDGDTILVETPRHSVSNNISRFKIRLVGIDAFELNQLPYGQKSKDFLAMLVLGKNVCIETDINEKDVYGRILGYVFVDEQVFINEELLKSGNAILSDFPPNIKYIKELKEAQILARKSMIGIWEKQDFIPQTPSQFRHSNKKHKRS